MSGDVSAETPKARVRDAVLAWMDRTGCNPEPEGGDWFALPVVGETYDAGRA